MKRTRMMVQDEVKREQRKTHSYTLLENLHASEGAESIPRGRNEKIGLNCRFFALRRSLPVVMAAKALFDPFFIKVNPINLSNFLQFLRSFSPFQQAILRSLLAA